MDFAELILATRSDGIRRGKQDLKDLTAAGRETEMAVGRMATSTTGSFNQVAVAAVKAAGLITSFMLSARTLSTASGYAREFGTAMARVSTVIEGTPAQMAALEAASRSFAKTYGTDATAQAAGFYQTLSAGITDVGEATEIMDIANKLALGGMTQVETAVDVLTSALAVYADTNLTAAQAADVLFVGAKDGKTDVDKLARSLGAILPIAKTMGLTFDEVVASVSALTLGGLNTSEAVTGMRALLTAVTQTADESSQASKTAQRLGLDFSVSGLQAKGFAVFMQDVIAATGGSVDEMSLLFGSVEGMNAALAMAGTAGAAYGNIMVDMGNKTGQTAVAVDKMAQDVDQRWRVALQRANDHLITLGNSLNAVILPALEMAGSALDFVANNTEAFGWALGVLAAAQLGPVIAATYEFITVLGLMGAAQYAGITSTGLLAGAMAALDAAFVLMGGPIGLLIIGIGAIGYAISQSGPAIDLLAEAQRGLNAAQDTFNNDKSPATIQALADQAQAYLAVAQAQMLLTNEQVRAQKLVVDESARNLGDFDPVTENEREILTDMLREQTLLVQQFMLAENRVNAIWDSLKKVGQAATEAANDASTIGDELDTAKTAANSVYIQMGNIGTWAQEAYLKSGQIAPAFTRAWTEADGLLGVLKSMASLSFNNLPGADGLLGGSTGSLGFGDATNDSGYTFGSPAAAAAVASSEYSLGVATEALAGSVETLGKSAGGAAGGVSDLEEEAHSLADGAKLYADKMQAITDAQVSALGGLTSVLQSVGSGDVTGTGSGLGSLGTTLSSMTGAAGSLGAAMGGVGAAIGAAVPYLAVLTFALEAFKTTTTILADGISGTITNLGVTAQQYQTIQKSSFFGLFKSTKTTTTTLTGEAGTALTDAFGAMQADVEGAAALLGVGSDAFKDFSYSFNVSLEGLSDEEKQRAINQAFTAASDAMAELALVGYEIPASAGGAAAYLSQLGDALTAYNASAARLGYTVMDVSVASGAAADAVTLLYGGLDAFTQATDYYFQTFYSTSEQLASVTSDLTAQLASLGINAIPDTTAEFKALVDTFQAAGDLDAVAALIQLAPEMASFIDLTAELTGVLADANAIAQERYNLETELLTLQGDTTALRERELALLDPTNQALQEQIWALEDLTAAAEAAQQVSDYYFQNIFDAQEQLDVLLQEFAESLAGLGVDELPTTADEFQALVDTFTAGGDAEAAATLMALAPEFLTITQLQQEAAQALEDAANSIIDAAGALYGFSDKESYASLYAYQKAQALGQAAYEAAPPPAANQSSAIPASPYPMPVTPSAKSAPPASPPASQTAEQTAVSQTLTLLDIKRELTKLNSSVQNWTAAGIPTRPV